MSIHETPQHILSVFCYQLRHGGFRVFSLDSGLSIKVYSKTLDSFANVTWKTPDKLWAFSTDRKPSAENGTGLCTRESFALHPAHVLEAVHISRYHPDRTTMQDFETRSTCPNWTEIL